jgi:GNAT superfamily N-acetyltransferase
MSRICEFRAMTGWTVRLASEADADGVAPVLCSAYPALDLPGQDPALIAAALAAITRPPLHLLASGRYFVAERNGELLGCGGWAPEPPPGIASRPGAGHLRHFATHAAAGGSGVGRSLYKACAEQCRGEGFGRLEVVSTPWAEGFYRALGFEALGPVEASIAGLALPAVYMTRKLAR